MKYVCVILFLFMVSCGQQLTEDSDRTNKRIKAKHEVLTFGKVHVEVQVQADTSQSYALYIPNSYEGTKQAFPIIYFFDAHKRGEMPVKMYAPLAEEYGFILAGSNNSANRQQPEVRDRIISGLFDDIAGRFNIDPSRVSVSGFSGGARVAAGIALFRKEHTTNVIGCAAGFPQLSIGYNKQFAYLGIVGDMDFNYLEMKSLERALDQTPIHHFLLVYRGKHDWPPARVMREGFEFLIFNAMRKKPALRNKERIESFISRNDSIRAEYRKANDLQKLAETDKKVLVFLQDLAPLKTYQAELDSLQDLVAYQKILKSEKTAMAFEQGQQQIYASSMTDKNIAWWMQEIDRLYQEPDDPVSRRLLSYLSLVSYMYANGSLRNNQLNEAHKYLEIYEKVDPDNPEVYYLKATWMARQHKPDEEILDALQKAVDLGFNESERMRKSKDFIHLHGNLKFKAIGNTADTIAAF